MSRVAVLAALGVALAMAPPASAQIGLSSSFQSVRLSAVKQGWVTVSGPLSGAVATSWNLNPDQTAAVTLVAQFAGMEGAIPALQVPGSPTPPPGGAGIRGTALVLFTQRIAATTALEMHLQLPTPPGLPPGTYTGTLNLVAITQ
jgi:hypothetical protein